MFKFEDLKVYQKGLILVDSIYAITKLWPKTEMFGLINQLRRASISIVLNIAEGSSRTNKDFGHFLSLSRGSCFECIAIFTIAKNQKFIDAQKYAELYEQCLELSRMLSSLRTKISK